MNLLKSFSMAMTLGRIADSLEDIAEQLRYQNERSFPALPLAKTEGKPQHIVFSRKKPDATEE
jgi:hypothetical protein